MKVSKLKVVFKYINFIEIENRYFIYEDYSMYDNKKEKEIQFKSLEELLNHEINGESISEKLDKIKIEFEYAGGRGANSFDQMGGGFEDGGGKKGPDKTKELPSAYFNRQGRFVTPEKAFRMFEDKYANADIEYALSIDKDGFVHKHKSGNPSSIRINAAGKEHMIIHNHPNGSNFSKADLLSAARDKKARGIIATGIKDGKLNRYTIEKTSKFNAKKFTQGINNAKWPKKYDYDKGAAWWLKNNQKKYGYKFKEIHTATKSSGKVIKDQISLF